MLHPLLLFLQFYSPQEKTNDTFENGINQQEQNNTNENDTNQQEKNNTKKKRKKHMGKYDLGIGLGVSISFYPIVDGIHETILRYANAIKNFQQGQLDGGSSYATNNGYGTSLGFQFEYHVHKAKFLFFRLGMNIDFLFAPYPKTFSIKTKPLGGDPALGLDIAYQFDFEFKNVYRITFPFLIGFEHNVGNFGTGFYFGLGGYAGVLNLIYETKGASSPTCITDLSTSLLTPVLEGQTVEDCTNPAPSNADLGKLLLKEDRPNTTNFKGTAFGATFLVGIKQRIVDSLYIFAEISINLGISISSGPAVSVAEDVGKSNLRGAFRAIEAAIVARRATGSSLLGSPELDRELSDVLDAFIGDRAPGSSIQSDTIGVLSLNPGSITGTYGSQSPRSSYFSIILDIGFSWRIGVSYLF